jgi:hypothetical protein
MLRTPGFSICEWTIGFRHDEKHVGQGFRPAGELLLGEYGCEETRGMFESVEVAAPRHAGRKPGGRAEALPHIHPCSAWRGKR